VGLRIGRGEEMGLEAGLEDGEGSHGGGSSRAWELALKRLCPQNCEAWNCRYRGDRLRWI